MKKIFLFFGLSFLLFSCEKDLNINLKSEDNAIVVDGKIEIGNIPTVTITNSIGFFDKIDLNSVSYVKNAIVKVSDITNNETIVLKEYIIDTFVDGHHYFFDTYGPDINDAVAMNFKGQINHIYKLSIDYNGKSHEAYTKIPSSSGIDSIWTQPVVGKENEYSTLMILYSDPDTLGNAVRYETLDKKYIKDTTSPEIFYASFNSIYNDDIINGIKIPVTLDLGYNKYKNYKNDELKNLGFVHKGDTVTLKWGAIDRNVYNFWLTLSYSANSVGNPFSTPTKIQGNVTDAIGVWAGYNNQYYTIIDSL